MPANRRATINDDIWSGRQRHGVNNDEEDEEEMSGTAAAVTSVTCSREEDHRRMFTVSKLSLPQNQQEMNI